MQSYQYCQQESRDDPLTNQAKLNTFDRSSENHYSQKRTFLNLIL